MKAKVKQTTQNYLEYFLKIIKDKNDFTIFEQKPLFISSYKTNAVPQSLMVTLIVSSFYSVVSFQGQTRMFQLLLNPEIR